MRNLLPVVILAALVTVAMITSEKPDPYKLGDQVEDFQLESTSGTEVSLSAYAGSKGTIIIFTCNTCPYAVLYEDRIIDIHNRYAPMGFPVLAIQPNDVASKPGDNMEAMKKRAEDKGFTFAYVLDIDQEVYPRFGATNTPQVYLVDSDRRLRYVGAIDDHPQDASAVKNKYLENALTAVAAGNFPEPAHTKAIGCTIKAKRKVG